MTLSTLRHSYNNIAAKTYIKNTLQEPEEHLLWNQEHPLFRISSPHQKNNEAIFTITRTIFDSFSDEKRALFFEAFPKISVTIQIATDISCYLTIAICRTSLLLKKMIDNKQYSYNRHCASLHLSLDSKDLTLLSVDIFTLFFELMSLSEEDQNRRFQKLKQYEIQQCIFLAQFLEHDFLEKKGYDFLTINHSCYRNIFISDAISNKRKENLFLHWLKEQNSLTWDEHQIDIFTRFGQFCTEINTFYSCFYNLTYENIIKITSYCKNIRHMKLENSTLCVEKLRVLLKDYNKK